MRKILLLLLSCTALSGSLYVPDRLSNVAVVNGPDGFAILKDNKIHQLGSESVDSTLRKMDFKQRSMFMLKEGSMAVDQDSEGTFHLKYAPKLNGGGRITGWICYAAVMIPGIAIIAVVKKCDRSGTAPTGEMFKNLQSVAKVAQSFGNSAPTP